MKNLVLAAMLTFPFLGSTQAAFGELIGTIVSPDDRLPLIGAKVQTISNGVYYKDITDLDGRFRISAIPAGKYLFMVIYSGDTLKNIHASISMDGIERLDTIEFQPQVKELDGIGVIYSKNDMHLRYGVLPEITMSAEDISRSPNRFDQKSMIAAMTSDVRVADDGQLMFRGARKGDMIYMMDGVKMTDVSNVPSASIGGMMVYTGGIPAKYGDTTGGVVVMETKSYFDLYRQWQINEYKKNNK